MNDRENIRPPAVLAVIEQETVALGFSMASEPQTGSLLRTLAATKPAGVFLELGTGTGLSTAWILDGMDNASTLTTVDNDASVQAVARRHLGADPRVTFHTADGAAFLETLREQQFDFVFAGPPYALGSIDELPKIIVEKKLIAEDGFFVLEHTPRNGYENFDGFSFVRNYGTTLFSFFAPIP